MRKTAIFYTYIIWCVAFSELKAQDAIFAISPASGLDAEMQAIVEKKLRGAAAYHQMGRDDRFGPLLLQPQVTFTPARNLNPGGQTPQWMLAGQLSCNLRLREGNVLLGQYRFRDTGSGASDSLARFDFLNKIRADSTDFDSLLEVAKQKLVEHFSERCPTLLATAQQKFSAGDFRAVFATLYPIPAACPCRAAVDSLLDASYRVQRDTVCQFFMEKAQQAAEVKDFSAILTALKYVDPESACLAEADVFAQKIRPRHDEYDVNQFDYLREGWKTRKSGRVLQRVIWKRFLFE